jgi:hypothetical protein
MTKDFMFELGGTYTNLRFEGQADYEFKETSFSHEYGFERRTDLVINDVSGNIIVVDDEGNDIGRLAVQNWAKDVEERVIYEIRRELE